ncbi:hypothetical protein EDC29_105153 [Marichromatium gracile]|uniref:Uncharacterized protein n=1 Tax=Marichromatium gracile TaxID=1048 RepID=A0A4R4AAI1_MARGR|nr:hypothetical protein EDC29_105153 [Marichromatium gracile]
MTGLTSFRQGALPNTLQRSTHRDGARSRIARSVGHARFHGVDRRPRADAERRLTLAGHPIRGWARGARFARDAACGGVGGRGPRHWAARRPVGGSRGMDPRPESGRHATRRIRALLREWRRDVPAIIGDDRAAGSSAEARWRSRVRPRLNEKTVQLHASDLGDPINRRMSDSGVDGARGLAAITLSCHAITGVETGIPATPTDLVRAWHREADLCFL